MNRKRLRPWLASAGTLLCAALCFGRTHSREPFAPSPMQQYVDAMQPGTNLGNTLDAIPTETSWGNPPTTQAIIQQIAAQGYKSIRIPVTWTDHTGPAPDYTVDPAWMNRVQQIVDWSLQAGMRVMLNMHHDSWQWVSALPQNHDAVIAQYTAVWRQIAERFKGYPNTLLFEAINEPTFKNVDTATALQDLDELETDFVHLVRGTGGMNATRPLVLTVLGGGATPASVAALRATIQHLDDPNLITTFHYYGYWPFSVNIVGYTAFNQGVITDIQSTFNTVYQTFVAHGIPAIVGEFGVLSSDHIERGEYLKYHEYVAHYARALHMTHMFWDAGQLFNRTTFQWNDPQLHAILQQTLTGRATTADTDLIFLKSGAPVQDAVIHLNLNGNRFVSLDDGATPLRRGIDYTLDDSVLTIKAKALSAYASGAFGEKAVLAVHVNSGPDWHLHVRYYGNVVLSPGSGTTGGAFVIPAAMNGDQLATMAATHADGTPAGPANWTPFQQWGVFVPDYTHNTITLTKDFFTGEAAGTINLTFYFWSGQKVSYQLSIHPGVSAGGPDDVVYDNALAPGWQNWSWAATNLANTTTAHSAPDSISVDAGPWGALDLANPGGPLPASTYHTLTFWAQGGPTGGQQIMIGATANWSGNGLPTFTIPALPANTWTKFEVPLASLGVDANPNLTSLYFMNTSGATEPTFYIDDIHLSPAYASWLLFVDGTPVSTADTTVSLTVRPHEVHRDGPDHGLVQVVDVINRGAHAVSGPIDLVLRGLSTNALVTNAAGLTSHVIPCGDPYLVVTTGGLAPGARARIKVEFSVARIRAARGDASHRAADDEGVGRDGKDVTYTPVVLGNGQVP